MRKSQTKRKTPSSGTGNRQKRRTLEGPMKLGISGFKSISEEQSVEIKPLTLLAGENSAGKSSMFQPLLLLKQTLEETFDPGALLLNGSNVKFTSADQLLWKPVSGERPDAFTVRVGYGGQDVKTRYQKQQGKGFGIPSMIATSGDIENQLSADTTNKEIEEMLKGIVSASGKYNQASTYSPRTQAEWIVTRNRCFLGLGIKGSDDKTVGVSSAFSLDEVFMGYISPALIRASADIRNLIHLPGLRGNPARDYPVSAVGSAFPGTFENYTASVIAEWGDQNSEKLEALCEDLRSLKLTSTVKAIRINDAQVELQVGRFPLFSLGQDPDMVNIADVGFGMSQTLPVVVALHAASPGQIVYIEQPELHLHPRAQVAMAEVLARAAKRGVRVVAETHSSLILMGVQTLVAEQKLDPSIVKLHWFTRKNGSTQVTDAEMDSAGRFGDWPVDFDDVSLEAQSRYFDAAEARLVAMAG